MTILLYFIIFYLIIALVFFLFVDECIIENNKLITGIKCKLIVSLGWIYIVYKAIKNKTLKLKGFNDECN